VSVPFRAPCAEFPNDNPELHDGAVWLCLTPVGPLRAIRRAPSVPALERAEAPTETATPAEPEQVECAAEHIAEPQSGIEPAAEPRAEPESEIEPAAELSAEPDPFEHLVEVMAKVALGAGATRAAALLPSLLRGEAVEESALGQERTAALMERGVLAKSGRGFSLSAHVLGTAVAWSRVLRGESCDLGECDGTLDSWLGQLIADLLGAPQRGDELRRELRGHGVAAFGLIVEAA